MDALLIWAENRRQTIKDLKFLEKTMINHATNAKIVSTVGTATGIISGIGAAVLYSIAPFTAGASLFPAGFLTGVSITGGVTSAGSSIVNDLLEKGCMKNVQAALDKDRDASAVLTRELKYTSATNAVTGLKCATAIGRTLSDGIQIGSKIVSNFSNSEKAAAGLMKLSKNVRIASNLVSFVVLPLDIMLFVKDAVGLANGDVSAAAVQVMELVKALQKEYDEMMSMVF